MSTTKILIPASDVKAALDRVIALLGRTSAQHAEEIGRYIHESFRPNEHLVPHGVAIMFAMGLNHFHAKMAQAIYPGMMTTMVGNMVGAELRTLPGVDDIFQRFEATQQ